MSDAAALHPDDWALWLSVTAMRAEVERRLEQRLQHDAGLSLADFEVLRGLTSAPDHRLRAGALAEALGWEKSRISHQVRRMAERGLLDRETCATDGRGTWVALGPAGADAFRSASCGYAEVLRETFFDRMSAADRTALRRVAERVRDDRRIPV